MTMSSVAFRPVPARTPWYAVAKATKKRGSTMGHRWLTSLTFLNALGVVLCVLLIAAALTKDDPSLAGQVALGVRLSLRLFVIGAILPAVAWGILAFEFDRTQSKKKSLESASVYSLLTISLILFLIAGWRLPQAFIFGLQIG
jgi:hypothetical protein